MIVSILTAVGMAIGVLIEALLGSPTVSTSTAQVPLPVIKRAKQVSG